MSQDVLVERLADVELVTLNRPRALNALTLEAYAALEHAVRYSESRCIVITGTDPAFCAGDDVREFMADGAHIDYLAQGAGLHSFTEAMLSTDIPIVAAVNGVAVGWGMELALLADIRIASPQARFGELFVLRGLCPDVAGLGLLSRLVGRDQATRLLLTGEIIDAEHARAIGLVSEVVEHSEVVHRAIQLATAIAQKPPLAVRCIKSGLRRSLDPDWHDLGTWVRNAQLNLAQTEDHQESVAAFLEKRPPQFQGR